MANWGAFAGGMARGIGSGAELVNMNRRTAMMDRETTLREQAGARAEEEMNWRRQEKERNDAYLKDLEDGGKDIPWVKGSDGKVDIFAPENSAAYQMMLGNQIRTASRHKKLPPETLLQFDAYKERLSDRKSQDALTAFVASGMNDISTLAPIFNKLGVPSEGSSIVRKKDPNGLEQVYIQSPDGKSMPVPYLLAMSGPAGQRVAAAMEKAEDNARANRQVAIQEENLKETRAIRRESAAAARENRPTADDKVLKSLDEKARRLPFRSYVSDVNQKPLDDKSGAALVADIAMDQYNPKGGEKQARTLVNKAHELVQKAGDDVYDELKANKEWRRLEPAARQAEFERKREMLVRYRLNPPKQTPLPQPRAIQLSPEEQAKIKPITR